MTRALEASWSGALTGTATPASTGSPLGALGYYVSENHQAVGANPRVKQAAQYIEDRYQMTKQLFENLPEMEAAHKAAAQIKLENALTGMPVPLHPGAERYYKEKGML